jgi:hypothetical protein
VNGGDYLVNNWILPADRKDGYNREIKWHQEARAFMKILQNSFVGCDELPY